VGDGEGERERDLVRRVDLGLVLHQQPHYIDVAVLGSLDEARPPVLRGGVGAIGEGRQSGTIGGRRLVRRVRS
jgi:hypothetical protein